MNNRRVEWARGLSKNPFRMGFLQFRIRMLGIHVWKSMSHCQHSQVSFTQMQTHLSFVRLSAFFNAGKILDRSIPFSDAVCQCTDSDSDSIHIHVYSRL